MTGATRCMDRPPLNRVSVPGWTSSSRRSPHSPASASSMIAGRSSRWRTWGTYSKAAACTRRAQHQRHDAVVGIEMPSELVARGELGHEARRDRVRAAVEGAPFQHLGDETSETVEEIEPPHGGPGLHLVEPHAAEAQPGGRAHAERKTVAVIDPPKRFRAQPIRFVLHGGESRGTDEARQCEHALRGQPLTAAANQRNGGGRIRLRNRISLEIDDVGNVGDHGSGGRTGAHRLVFSPRNESSSRGSD